ncbi:MAG: hypothetical protein WCV90_07975 [Candidatus Woesearchaeota archaeon]
MKYLTTLLMAAGLATACSGTPSNPNEMLLNLNGREYITFYEGQQFRALKGVNTGSGDNNYCFYAPSHEIDCSGKPLAISMDSQGILAIDQLVAAQLSARNATEKRISEFHKNR